MARHALRIVVLLLAAGSLSALAVPGRGEARVDVTSTAAPGAAPDSAIPNDNRVAAGRMEGGVLRLRLEARLAGWRPDLGVDSLVTVQAFAEAGSAARIPGPLVRARVGTEIEITLRNALDSALVVTGLRAGDFAEDTVQVAAGATRTVRFLARTPGTFLYWGTTTGSSISERMHRDGQLTGAIVIDPRDAVRDTAERIFVMTVIDYVPDDTVRNRKKEDIWDLAINGRSWPHTERITYPVGARVRWRWLNGSYLPHPMHLHGFHFDVSSKGARNRDSLFVPEQRRRVVTEYLLAGQTFSMEWTPTRAGQWLMHCHMLPHTTPFPERPDSVRAHEAHDASHHPQRAMSGLILGVTTVDRRAPSTTIAAPRRSMRLFVQQAGSGKAIRYGYALQRGAEPATDSVPVPGTPLVLTRGERTAITVVNRMREATAVHWHGMEIESVYDGVPGLGSTPTLQAPMIAPGDSFMVTMTPPRAGTFMYHTHIDEGKQLQSGLYAPMIVLEPGARLDPSTDHVIMLGQIATPTGEPRFALNGSTPPPPLELRVGVAQRLRIVNIMGAPGSRVQLTMDSLPVTWRPIAKDGADLPAAHRTARPARLVIGPGETYDFLWTPSRPMRARLIARVEEPGNVVELVQEIRVR